MRFGARFEAALLPDKRQHKGAVNAICRNIDNRITAFEQRQGQAIRRIAAQARRQRQLHGGVLIVAGKGH